MMTATSETGVQDIAAPRVLVADDHVDVISAIRLLLKTEGYIVDGVSSPEALLQALGRQTFDLVLVDLNYTRDTTSGQEGLKLVAQLRALDREIPVVAMTAWGTVDLAVDAMRTGVDDFIQKPWDNTRLLANVRRQIQTGRARRQQQRVNAEHEDALANERAAAREIQRTMLPAQLPSLRGAGMAAFWEPAGDVGGDFYDMARLDDHRTWLCIGDAAGKGMSAALLMANVQALVRSSALAAISPGALCATVNRELCARITTNRFVTFFYCVYDSSRRLLSYANAGHNPPLVVRRDGQVTTLTNGGPVLGILGDALYAEGEIRLDAGDRFVMFTDGVTEVRNQEGIELTDERIAELAAEHRHMDAHDLSAAIVGAARTFSGGAFEDDATLIVMAVGD